MVSVESPASITEFEYTSTEQLELADSRAGASKKRLSCGLEATSDTVGATLLLDWWLVERREWVVSPRSL